METVTLKACFKCSRELPITEFYKHPYMADGHLGKCKECTRRDVTEHRIKNVERVREYDRMRGKRESRKLAFKKKNQAKAEKMGYSYSHSHRTLIYAVRSGKIERPDACSRCGTNGSIQAHHDDYSKPLDVLWLCPVCHANRHKELGRLRMIRASYGPDPSLSF